jgi:hypothetical protein
VLLSRPHLHRGRAARLGQSGNGRRRHGDSTFRARPRRRITRSSSGCEPSPLRRTRGRKFIAAMSFRVAAGLTFRHHVAATSTCATSADVSGSRRRTQSGSTRFASRTTCVTRTRPSRFAPASPSSTYPASWAPAWRYVPFDPKRVRVRRPERESRPDRSPAARGRSTSPGPACGNVTRNSAHATRFNASPRSCCSRTQARIAREWLMMVPSGSLSVGSFFVPVAANS